MAQLLRQIRFSRMVEFEIVRVVVFSMVATVSRVLQINFCIRKRPPNLATDLFISIYNYLYREIDCLTFICPSDNARRKNFYPHKNLIANVA